MNIVLALEIMDLILICIIIVMGLYVKALSNENESQNEAIRGIRAELEAVRSKQRVFEKRFMRMAEPEKLIIENRKPDYGGF